MHRNSTKHYMVVVISLLLLLIAGIMLSLTNGEFNMTIVEVMRTLLRMDPAHEHDLVLFTFRLPRIVVAIFVGLGLGVAGAVMQAITRNGLADPGILGVNAGAGAAIVLYMYILESIGITAEWPTMFSIPLFGLIGGIATGICIYLFSFEHGKLDSQRLILVGIAFGMGLGAFTLYLSLKMNPQNFEVATLWLAGSISNVKWEEITAMIPWFLIILPIIIIRASVLDLFAIGEDIAKNVGVRAEWEKTLLLLGSVGLVGACVSVSGSIGFVGLLAPHIARRLVGTEHRRILLVSGAVGMVLVVIADFIAKTIFSPVELPVGVVIAIIGVPYFIYLLYKGKTAY